MRIKKTSETTPTMGSIVDGYSASTQDGYSCDYINNLHTYSTNEIRVGTWIDGKPVYRIVYTGTANSGNHTVASLSSISGKNIIRIDGWIYQSATVQQQLGTYSNAYNSSGVYVDNNGLKLLLPEAWLPSTYYIIVEYTKTTD